MDCVVSFWTIQCYILIWKFHCEEGKGMVEFKILHFKFKKHLILSYIQSWLLYSSLQHLPSKQIIIIIYEEETTPEKNALISKIWSKSKTCEQHSLFEIICRIFPASTSIECNIFCDIFCMSFIYLYTTFHIIWWSFIRSFKQIIKRWFVNISWICDILFLIRIYGKLHHWIRFMFLRCV